MGCVGVGCGVWGVRGGGGGGGGDRAGRGLQKWMLLRAEGGPPRPFHASNPNLFLLLLLLLLPLLLFLQVPGQGVCG